MKDRLLEGAARHIYIRFPNGEYEDITSGILSESMSLDQVLNSSADLNFGECNASKFEVEIAGVADITGLKIQVYELVEGYPKEIPMFTGIVDSAKIEPERTTRKVIAYDELYFHSDDNVSEWYDSMFTQTDKSEYKGIWNAVGRYISGNTVQYNGVFYQYLCGTSDQFSVVTDYDDDGNEITVTYNAADYCKGKTPEQLLSDEHGYNYIQQLDVYNPYNYGSVPLKAFRVSLMQYVGIQQEDVTLINDNIQVTKTLDSTELKFSDCIKAICQMAACFGHISGTGIFQYVYFGSDSIDYSGNYKASKSTYEEFVTKAIDSVRIYNNAGEVAAINGAGDNIWNLQNNFLLYGLSDDVLNTVTRNLYARVSTIAYTPASLEALLSLPVELGDKISVTTHTGDKFGFYVLKNNLSGGQLTSQIISADGSEKRNNSTTLSNQLALLESKTTAIIEKTYQKIIADSAEIKRVYGDLANYKTVVADRIQAVYAEIEKMDVTDLTARVATIEKAYITEADVDTILVKKAYLTNADIQELTAKVAEIDSAYITSASMESLLAGYATIAQLNVTNETVHSIQGDYAEFKTATAQEFSAQTGIISNLSGQFSSYQTQMAQELIAAKGWMAEGSIGSAQIQSLDVNKLNAGTIDTTKIGLASQDSSLQITGSQILVNDTTDVLNPYNRVIVGKYTNAEGDSEYGLLVRAEDGQTVMIDGEGVHNAGITDGAIDNNKVADDANISSYKIDLRAINEAMTEQGVRIDETVVRVGDKSLEIVLKEQTQEITDTTERIGEIESRKMYRIETHISGKQIFTDKGQTAVMSCRVLSWDEDVTESLDDSLFFWHRVSGNDGSDAEWDRYHAGMKQVNITTEDVLDNASFYCEVVI